MRKPAHSASGKQEMALEGFGVSASASQDNVPSTSPQPQKRLSVVYGTCCRCGERPATLKSPSGQSIYCAGCGRSRCGVHTIADFELEESTGSWLDPCAVKHNWKQQSLVSEE